MRVPYISESAGRDRVLLARRLIIKLKGQPFFAQTIRHALGEGRQASLIETGERRIVGELLQILDAHAFGGADRSDEPQELRIAEDQRRLVSRWLVQCHGGHSLYVPNKRLDDRYQRAVPPLKPEDSGQVFVRHPGNLIHGTVVFEAVFAVGDHHQPFKPDRRLEAPKQEITFRAKAGFRWGRSTRAHPARPAHCLIHGRRCPR